ncbi:hypothetical protein TGAM01_v207621 [Trichoderma gamsii]|uniref:Uncharacterized protein n=1 Tax=Trichoderma gamsii TaxID=398673 RepID=A0A2P4ZGJ5_9HYPO|nr:hypothetical protein TGAM01_v207621 [Trichoderma gamsii]PON23387.1 hypothetical protein TGAM01_v207621 [Trichoderma gamsii]
MWCHCRKGVGCCRPNARFRRGLKRRSSCLMHAYHGVCKSSYLHNHNMHAFDTALPTTSVLHISCMNALCTLGRRSPSTMFATNDAEDFFTTGVTTAICPQQKAFAMLCTDAQLQTLY